MNIKVEDVSSVKKKLSFEVPAEKVDTEIEKAYRKIGKTAKIKGFRPGKVPKRILEQHYAPQMEQEVLGRLINETYFQALRDHDIAAVADPEIVENGTLEPGETFRYQAEVEVRPEVTARDYAGLKLQKEKLELDDAVISSRLDEMRASRAEMEVSARNVAAKGDFVTIDFEGFVDGEAFPGGQATGHVLELGSGAFIPGFEEQLEGMERGGSREVAVTFPEAYGNKELAGKPATFKVTLSEIKEKTLPELDDEFAKGFGLETAADLQAKVAESYRSQETARVDGDLRDKLMNALIERNPIEVPEALVAQQLTYMLGNITKRLESQGMSLEMLGMNEDSFKESHRETALKQVQGSFLLEAIYRQEGLKVEEGEIDGKLEEIARMANAPLEAVQKHYAGAEARRSLMAQVEEEKVIQFLLDQAIIEEVAKADLAEDTQDQSAGTDKE